MMKIEKASYWIVAGKVRFLRHEIKILKTTCPAPTRFVWKHGSPNPGIRKLRDKENDTLRSRSRQPKKRSEPLFEEL
jgi:hypothetical protein